MREISKFGASLEAWRQAPRSTTAPAVRSLIPRRSGRVAHGQLQPLGRSRVSSRAKASLKSALLASASSTSSRTTFLDPLRARVNRVAPAALAIGATPLGAALVFAAAAVA